MALQVQPARTLVSVPPPVPSADIVSAALVALCGAMALASFLTSDPLRNDFERFTTLWLLFVFFVLFAALSAAYFALYRQGATISSRHPVVITLGCVGCLLISFPVGSKDIFGYAFLGRMWGTLHVNPYVVSPLQFSSDGWFPSLVGTLRRPLSVYGPLFMWQSWLVNAMAGQSLWVAVWLHKIVAVLELLAALGIARASLAAVPTAAPRPWLLLLLAWNPLLLFEAAGSAHNDVAMVLLLTAAIWCWNAGRSRAAFGCLVLSFWYKWYGLIFVPAFLIEALKIEGLRAAARQALWFTVYTAVCGVLLLVPLHGAVPSIVAQFAHPEKMRGIFPNELSPPLAVLFWSLRAAGLFATDRGFDIFNGIRSAAFAAAISVTFIRQWRAAPSIPALLESCTLSGLAFFMLLITQLWPWHLLTVITMSILTGREPFIGLGVVLSILALLSNFVTFAVATLMFGAVAGALWLMRRPRKSPAAVPI